MALSVLDGPLCFPLAQSTSVE